MENQKQKYTFNLHGMHCNACVLLTEEEAKDIAGVTSAVSSLKHHTIELCGDFDGKSREEIMQLLNTELERHGYKVSTEKAKHFVKWSEFNVAVPMALAFIIVFILLQKMGILNLVNTNSMSYGTAFLVGIIASLSTCMAVVGGLVLSMSATFAKDGDKIKPQILFHIGRIISFFILGGIIGLIGGAFVLDTSMTFILGIVIGIVMLIMGVNLIDIFHFTKKLQPSMPKFISKHMIGITKLNHSLTPLLVGIATFFLPCGFTQSMQIYTLSTGSFLTGALTMLSFALGTLPVLALLSFSSFSIQKSSKSGIFFKTAGLIVILFALFNIINSLVVIGIIPPIFNF